MENLMIFEGHDVEVFELDGKVLFNPYHVGRCLGLGSSAVKMAVSKMNEKQVIKVTNSKVKDIDFRKLHNTGENFLTESGVYKLVFKSHKPNAEKFTDCVTDEVLPSIRKNGGYIAGQETLSDEDLLAKAILVAHKKIEEREKVIAEQKDRIMQQEDIINKQETDNKVLAGKILEWKDRKRINHGVRKLAAATGALYGSMWKKIYNQLYEKASIDVYTRKRNDAGNKKVPYLDYIKENEWDIVLQISSAICKVYGESPTEMLKENIPVENLKTNNENKYDWLDAM